MPLLHYQFYRLLQTTQQLEMFLQSLNSDMLSSQGTAIIEAVKLAKDYYDDENQTNRVLCILSDGEDHEFKNQNIPSIVQEMGITIFTVGLGTTKGAPIPIKKNEVIESYKKNSSNWEIVSPEICGGIFDAAAIGQYCFGLDQKINRYTPTYNLFENEFSNINFKKLKIFSSFPPLI